MNLVMHPLISCFLLTLLATAILMQPIVRYLAAGWLAKRKDIMDALTPSARKAYFLMFGCSEALPKDVAEACIKFESLYTHWYGRRYFVLPTALLLAIGFMAASAVIFSAIGPDVIPNNILFNLPTIAIAALSGAYLWVVNDHIDRARRLDFSPADVMWGVLRLAIAVPMGYAFGAIFKADVGPFIAFGFGAFPLTSLISIIRRLTEKRLELDSSDVADSDEVVKLQGINKVIVERLAKEDITTITQIAYCDPVRITMRSNLSFNFIIDCVNQSLAWLYLAEAMNIVRPMGLRGAVEIRYLMSDFDDDSGGTAENTAREQAAVLIKQVAENIKQTPEAVEFAFRQIADDPYTIFMYEIWQTPDGLEGCSTLNAAVPPVQ